MQYGAVVGNPFMLIPTVLIAIILPGFSYLWFAMGWGTINYVNFDMNFAPTPCLPSSCPAVTGATFC